MNHSDYRAQTQVQHLTLEHLEKILLLKKLPIEVRNIIEQTKTQVQSCYDTVLKPTLQKLTGSLLTSEEVLKIINEVSASEDWDLDDDEVSEEKNWKLVNIKETFDDSDLMSLGFGIHPKTYADTYGLDIAINETKIYEFSRKQYNGYNYAQGDIRRIVVQCLPGHLDVYFDAGSVGYSLEKIITNAQLKKQLKGHI